MAWNTKAEIKANLKRSIGTLINITLFAIAMGYLEAVVVVYLRSILTRRADWKAIEITREYATLVMLVTLAMIAGRNPRERTGAFLWIFWIWDIVYYLGLWIWLQWPESLLTLDTLFYIPCVWAAPVYIPVVFSVILMGVGMALFIDYGVRWIRRISFWTLLGWILGLAVGAIQAWYHGTSIPVSAMGMSFYLGLLAAGFGIGTVVGLTSSRGQVWVGSTVMGFLMGLLAVLGQRMFYVSEITLVTSGLFGAIIGLAGGLTAKFTNAWRHPRV